LSTIIPVLILSLIIVIPKYNFGNYGIALVGLGFLIMLPSFIINKIFGPISDQA